MLGRPESIATAAGTNPSGIAGITTEAAFATSVTAATAGIAPAATTTGAVAAPFKKKRREYLSIALYPFHSKNSTNKKPFEDTTKLILSRSTYRTSTYRTFST